MLFACLVLFLTSLGQGVTLPLLPALSQSGSEQAQLLGVVYGAHAAARIVTQPMGGVWVDRRGGERVLVVASILYTASLSGFLFTSSPWFSLVLRVLGGVASGLAQPAAFALVLGGVAPSAQGKRVATVLGLGSAGMVVGPVIAAAFSKDRSPTLPVLVALVPSVVITVVLFAKHVGRGLSPVAKEPTVVGNDRVPSRAFHGLALDAALVASVLPIAFNKLTFSAFQALLPVYGPEALGLDSRGVSLLFLGTGVVFAAVQPLGGFVVDRFPSRTVSIALTPLLVAVLASMSFVTRPASFVALYLGYIAVASIIYVATLKVLVSTQGPDARLGALYGSTATLTDPAMVLGPVIFMGAYATLASYSFVVMAAVGLAVGGLFVGCTRPPASR